MKATYRSAAVLTVCATALAACGDRTVQDDATLDTPPPAAEAPGAPAPTELQDEADSFVAAWNQEDPILVAEYFTNDATVHAGDSTYTGRQQIMQRWLEPNVPGISNVHVHDERWAAAGEEYRGTGRYTMDVRTPDGQTMQDSGTFDGTWIRTPENVWRMRTLRITSDNPQ